MTGATGFVGSWVARALLDAGWEVHALVRASSNTDFLTSRDPRPLLYDCRAGENVVAMSKRLDAVVHCAADMGRLAPGRNGRLVDAAPGEGSDARVLEANVAFPLRLLEAAVARKVPIFLSTDTCVPKHYPAMRPYALSKAQFVEWGQAACAGTETRFVNLRLCQPYGPRLRPGMFVHWLLRRCLEGGTIPLTPGGQIRDFTYVSDVAAAYLAVLDKTASLPAGFSHFDCGTGAGVMIREFAELAHGLLRSTATLQFGALPYREREFDWVARAEPLMALGWRPTVGVMEGIKRMVAEEFRVEPWRD